MCIYIYTVTHIIIQYDTHLELQYTPFLVMLHTMVSCEVWKIHPACRVATYC